MSRPIAAFSSGSVSRPIPPEASASWRHGRRPAPARALLFSAGYLANLAIVTALADRGDAIFADKLNHTSLVDAAHAPFLSHPEEFFAAFEAFIDDA